jgi:hypothetical protein
MRMVFPSVWLSGVRQPSLISGYAGNARRMDQYGRIWKDTNAIPEIGYVDLALPTELIWFDGVPTSTLPS